MTWLDVLKLTVPFVTAIIMIWIKTTIECSMTRKNKQHVISRLIADEVGELADVANALKRIGESAANRKLRIVTINNSSLIGKLCLELSDLDAKHAYCYSDLASSIDIANAGLARLFSFIERRAASDGEKVTGQLDRAIIGQTKILVSDFISLGKSSLKVMEAIPSSNRYGDHQIIDALSKSIESAEKTLENWPHLSAQEITDQPNAPRDEPQAVRL